MAKIKLPNGGAYGKITVTPVNWDTGGVELMKVDWKIRYTYYPILGKENNIVIRKMNTSKTIIKRREATRLYIKDEIEKLEAGYIPVVKNIMSKDENTTDINPKSFFLDALQFAYGEVQGSDIKKTVKDDYRSCLKYVSAAAKNLKLDLLEINEIRVAQIKLLFAELPKVEIKEENGKISKLKFSNDRQNKYRGYLGHLFVVLQKNEIVELGYNPIKVIDKKKVLQKLQKTLTTSDREMINSYLHKNHYEFWRFLHIFYHSGGREIELINIKVKDVDLENQMYIATIQKGGLWEEVPMAIKDNVKHLWAELIKGAKPEYYVFSKGLKPGLNDTDQKNGKQRTTNIGEPKPVNPKQLSRRWRTHVKEKLGINCNLYSLKHLSLQNTAIEIEQKSNYKEGIEVASKQGNHTNKKTTLKFYLTQEQQLQASRVKGLTHEF